MIPSRDLTSLDYKITQLEIKTLSTKNSKSSWYDSQKNGERLAYSGRVIIHPYQTINMEA